MMSVQPAASLTLPQSILDQIEKNETEKILTDVKNGLIDINHCFDDYTPLIEKAFESGNISLCSRLITERPQTSSSQLKGLFSDLLKQISNWNSKIHREDENYLCFLSKLVWQKSHSFLDLRNFIKYLGHLRRLKAVHSAQDPNQQIKFEYWIPDRFLPLRIHSLVLTYLDLVKGNIQDQPQKSSKVQELLLNEISSELETLRNYHILLLINRADIDEEDEEVLLAALIDNIAIKCFEISDIYQAYCIVSGFKGHYLYINIAFSEDKKWVIFRVDNQGALAAEKHRIDETKSTNTKRIYPYLGRFGVFETEKSAISKKSSSKGNFLNT